MNCRERKVSALCVFTTEKPVMSHSTLNHLCSVTILLGLAWSSNGFGETTPKANPVDAHFSAMDTNSDGKLSPDEHAAGARKMFNTMDANKDGRVTAAEMDTAHEKVAGKRATQADLSSAEKIKVVDTDGDGILTADEHATGSKMMFDKMDTNKDGFVSKPELEAGHAAMMRKESK
jgi:Ca2+-binding EF-hand superfamily protein